jgi:hypothetical protein
MKKRLSIITILTVAVFSATFAGLAGKQETTAEGAAFWRDYSNVDTSVPYFYSPESWFKWPQRYIYNITGGGHSYLEGYGDIHSDWIYQGVVYNQTYKSGDAGITQLFVRTEGYSADFEPNNIGWSWWLKRMATEEMDLTFEDEVLFFDYPLGLNKRWGGSSNILLNKEGELIPFGKVDYEVEVTRYVPKYKVPEQLGLSVNLDKAKAKWTNAKNLYPPGCLVTELRLTFSTPQGDFTQTMEIWKDIRGCVPVQRTYANGELMVEEIARKWTGNIS